MRCGHDHSSYDHFKFGKGYKAIDFPKNDPESAEFLEEISIGEKYVAGNETNNQEVKVINELIALKLYEQALSYITSKIVAGDIDSASYNYMKICLLYNLNRHEDVIYEYNFSLSESMKKDCKTIYIVANAYNSLQNLSLAEYYYKSIISDCNDNNLSEKSSVHLALVLARQEKYDEGFAVLSRIPKNSNFAPYANNSLISIEQLENLKGKSKFAAGLLGIVPGGGYLYAGKKGTALASFLLNGVLGYAVYESINSKLYGLGSLIGLFNAAFYVGSIKGGVDAVKKNNERKRGQLLKNFSKLEY